MRSRRLPLPASTLALLICASALSAATPLVNPDFCKLAEAYGIRAIRVNERGEVVPAVQEARAHRGTAVLDFRVEQEDSVYPMVPAGRDLHDMIRRPSPIAETGADA